jgi:hypothetical protein
MHKVIVVLYFCFSLFVVAESSIKINDNLSVQTLVQQVKVAKPSEKRVLMNRLKVMLRQSNKIHRQQVMYELKQSFSHGSTILKEKQKNTSSAHSGTHQPKHRQYQYGKGDGKRSGGHQH